MPLYICNDPYGWGTAVENDLYTLVGQDSQHFGDNNTGQTADCVSGLVQIQYSNPLPQTAGQVLISNLCTKTPQTSIIVYGVDPTWPIPNTPFHIYDKAGWTVEPSAPGAPIKIIYDASNGFGGGYTVFDAAGNHIAFPTFLILAHELFHAWHLATKTEVADAAPRGLNDENT